MDRSERSFTIMGYVLSASIGFHIPFCVICVLAHTVVNLSLTGWCQPGYRRMCPWRDCLYKDMICSLSQWTGLSLQGLTTSWIRTLWRGSVLRGYKLLSILVDRSSPPGNLSNIRPKPWRRGVRQGKSYINP